MTKGHLSQATMKAIMVVQKHLDNSESIQAVEAIELLQSLHQMKIAANRADLAVVDEINAVIDEIIDFIERG